MNRSKIFLMCFALFIACTSAFSQERYVTTSDGVKLYVNVKGSGTPCLFIHGGPGQGSIYWEKTVGSMCEQHFQMIYLDQRGCGRSESPKDENYSMDRMVKDFEEVREALNIMEWFVMGHSFAGILQTGYAKKHSKKIKGMLMFNCTLDMIGSLENNYIPRAMEFFKVEDTTPYTDKSIAITARFGALQQLFGTRPDVWKLSFDTMEAAQKYGQCYAGFSSWNTDFTKFAFQTEDYLQDYTIITQDIETPVLFLYGKKDFNTGVDHYTRLKFPYLKVYSVEGGHMAFIDDTSEYENAINVFMNSFKKSNETVRY